MTNEQLEVETLKTRAWELYLKGKSSRAIGKELNMSHAQICNWVNATMQELAAERKAHAREYVQAELDRLDKMLLAFESQAHCGDKDAAEVILKIQARRAKYLGLDQPDKLEHSGTVGIADALTKARARVEDEKEKEKTGK